MKPKPDALEQELDEFLSTSKTLTTDGDGTAIILTTPVETAPGSFMKLEDIPGNLPPLPEEKMDFAFRYATEYHSMVEWAKIFGKGESTIGIWLRDPVVRYHIAMVRYERRAYNAARLLRIERATLDKLHEILTTKLTNENMAVILQAIKYVMDWLSGANRLPPVIGAEVRREMEQERKMIGEKLVEHGEKLANEDDEITHLRDELTEIEQIEKTIALHEAGKAGGNGRGTVAPKGTDVGGLPTP